MGIFKDFYRDGEEAGGQGDGFKDFVAAPVPVKTELPIEEVKIEAPIQNLKCPNCEYTTTYKIALSQHLKTHK